MSKEAILTHTTIHDVTIPIIYEHSSLIPTGIVQLVFQGGGAFADGEQYGRSALLEEMLERGSKIKGNIGFAKALESKAISLDVASGLHTLRFSLRFLQEDTTEALKLLGELLLQPNLTASELKKAKTALIAKILDNQHDYDYLARQLLHQALFAHTPMAHSKLGTPTSIQALSLRDMKNALNDALMLRRLIIIIGGDISQDVILSLLTPILSHLPIGTPYEKPTITAQQTPSTRTQSAPTEQAYIYFGAPLELHDMRQSHIAKVASFILGSGGFGSRILEEVRVKHGLAYSAYLSYHINPHLPYVSGYLQTKLDSKEQAITLVKHIMNDFVEHGATQDELDSAKKFLLGSEPLRSETLEQRLNRAFEEYYLGVGLGFFNNELKHIKALSLATLNDYITKHAEILRLSFGIITAPSSSSTTPTKDKHAK